MRCCGEPAYNRIDFTKPHLYTYAATPFHQPDLVYEQVCEDFDYPIDIEPHPWNQLDSTGLLDTLYTFNWNEITPEDRLNPDYIYLGWYPLVADHITVTEYQHLLATGFKTFRL